MRDKQSFGYSVMLVLLEKAVRLLCLTLRVRARNYSGVKELFTGGRAVMLAFWHGTMMVPWYYHRGQGITGMISRSKDGEMLARLLENWRYRVIRGSSSKGGKEALNSIVETLKQDLSVALTPDGPRGPMYEFKPGAVVAAMRGGVPLVLVGAAYKKKKCLGSWDRFQIPYPFTRVNLVYSAPVTIPRDAQRDEVSAQIEQCGAELRRLQKEAEQF